MEMVEGMNSEILQKIMDEHPDAPLHVQFVNALAIVKMQIQEQEQGNANVDEANKIINGSR